MGCFIKEFAERLAASSALVIWPLMAAALGPGLEEE